MERRQSISDFVLPRVPRGREAAPDAPTVPSFEELWPETAADGGAPIIVGEPVETAAPAAPLAPITSVVTVDEPPAEVTRPLRRLPGELTRPRPRGLRPVTDWPPAPTPGDTATATDPAPVTPVTDAGPATDDLLDLEAAFTVQTPAGDVVESTTDDAVGQPADTEPADDEPADDEEPGRSDVRPLAAVTPISRPESADVPAARELTAFPASAIDTRRARARLAGVAELPAPVEDDHRPGRPLNPQDAQMLGARHEARHQAARTDVDGLHDMMKQLLAAGGSDLHLTASAPPTIRVHGSLRRIADHGPMSAIEIEALLRGIVDGAQWHTFEQTNELDFAYTAPEIGRFRVNVYRQRGACGAAFRAIPTVIPELSTLGLPRQVEQFAGLPRGLVLVTGPTGSGKTTTLAALLALANRLRSPHIVTIEDPIEFLHEHGNGLVNQREVGGDTESFAAALKHALRQDPDVILVGELRDLETTATALTAAETGHLVFATLHTQSAAQTVDRIIDIFPAHQQGEVRAQLASTLRGVVTQALTPRADGSGRAVVAEIMVATPAIRNLIREGKTHQIPSFMQAGARDGMLSFDQHLAELVRSGVVAYDVAMSLCHSPEDLARLARTVIA